MSVFLFLGWRQTKAFFFLLITIMGRPWHGSMVEGRSQTTGTTTATTTTTTTTTEAVDSLIGTIRKNDEFLPAWLEIQHHPNILNTFITLARQRHVEAIQKAKEAYHHFHHHHHHHHHHHPTTPGVQDMKENGNEDRQGKTKESLRLTSLRWEEYTITSGNNLPDFSSELERKIYVTSLDTPLFSKEECIEVIQMAEDHFDHQSWTTLSSGQYDVAGFWIRDVPTVHKWFQRMVQERLFPLLQQTFPQFVEHVNDLVVDNAYLFKYTPETGRKTGVHTDSGCLSFTIALNGKDEYAGGGTWFEGLQSRSNGKTQKTNVIEMNVGQCTIRPGGVRHSGNAVTSGTRYIIGGFCMNVHKVELVRMLVGLGNEEAQAGNLDVAQQAFEAAIALNPKFDGPYSHLASLLEGRGQTTKAQQVLEFCHHHVNPDSAEVAYSLGVMYLDQKQYEKAAKCMSTCLESDDCDVDAMLALAQACAGLGDTTGEEMWYERIVSTHGASPEATAKAYCNLGVLKEGTDMETVYYEKSLEHKPNFPACYSLGCAYASKQDWTRATSSLRMAIDIAQDGSADEMEALQTLYRVVSTMLKEQQPEGPSSREEMMKQFIRLMGEENFEKLSGKR